MAPTKASDVARAICHDLHEGDIAPSLGKLSLEEMESARLRIEELILAYGWVRPDEPPAAKCDRCGHIASVGCIGQKCGVLGFCPGNIVADYGPLAR